MGNVWWKVKPTFLPMASILALHHKQMKLVKLFTPLVIVCPVRKVFLSNERTESEIAVFIS